MTTFYPEELPPEFHAHVAGLAQLPEPASTMAFPPPPATYPPATYPRADFQGPRTPPRAPRSARFAVTLRWVVILTSASLSLLHIQSQRERTYSDYERTTFVEIVPGIPSGSLRGASLAESEELARTFSARSDSNGSFVASGLELAWLFGVNVTWSTSVHDSRCAISNPGGTTVAWYCGGGEPTIVLNREANVMPMYLYNPEFIDAIKHELAHHSITQRCGTSKPAAAGALPEGVTNSYAILTLGADRGRLAEMSQGSPDYQFDATTDAAAREISLGSC